MFLTLKKIKIFDYKFPPLKILEIIYILRQRGETYLRCPEIFWKKGDSGNRN